MSREIDRKYGSGVTTFKSAESVSDARGQKRNKKAAKFKYKMSGSPERSRNTQYEGRPTGVPGERQIGRNTFRVSADLVKQDLMAGRKAAEDAKPFKTGGMCRGAGAAVKGTKFEGVF